jgi:type VI secretion system secreted protein VgrG
MFNPANRASFTLEIAGFEHGLRVLAFFSTALTGICWFLQTIPFNCQCSNRRLLMQNSGQVAESSVINRFNVRLATRSGKASHQTYHFQLPQVDLLSSAGGDGRRELEDYPYPAPFTDLSVGTRQAQKALERNRSDVQIASGNSDQSALVSGHLFELTHPNPEWSQQWLLTSVFHEGKQPHVLEESMPKASGAFTQGYRNRFEEGQVLLGP